MQPAEREWNCFEPDATTVRRLTSDLDCTDAVATVLANRGITSPDVARRYLSPTRDELHDPNLLPDMDTSLDRIQGAITHGETITIYGDRDVDGVTGTAILLHLFDTLDATVGYIFPGKYDGFGLHVDHIDRLAARDTDLIITVDCGTADRREIALAKEHDMDVILTDHHRQDTTPSVPCVNPQREDSVYPHASLTGAGIAYKLGEAIAAQFNLRRDEYDAYSLPLAALGTVVDHGAVTLENRAIVVNGFDRMSACPLPGLRILFEEGEVTSIRDLGWSVGPLLSAAQEDQSSDLMLRVLLAEDANFIHSQIEVLQSYRENRRDERRGWQEELESCLDSATTIEDDILLVETDSYAVPAARTVSERLGLPVLSYHAKHDTFYGGGRTDLDIDLRAVLDACTTTADRAWGHPGAAGFEVDESNWNAFCESLPAELHRQYSAEELKPRIDIDFVLNPADISDRLLTSLETLRPFGDDFEEPIMLVRGITLTDFSRFGKTDAHLSFSTPNNNLRLVYWNGAYAGNLWEGPDRYDIVGTLTADSTSGLPTISMTDIAISDD